MILEGLIEVIINLSEVLATFGNATHLRERPTHEHSIVTIDSRRKIVVIEISVHEVFEPFRIVACAVEHRCVFRIQSKHETLALGFYIGLQDRIHVEAVLGSVCKARIAVQIIVKKIDIFQLIGMSFVERNLEINDMSRNRHQRTSRQFVAVDSIANRERTFSFRIAATQDYIAMVAVLGSPYGIKCRRLYFKSLIGLDEINTNFLERFRFRSGLREGETSQALARLISCREMIVEFFVGKVIRLCCRPFRIVEHGIVCSLVRIEGEDVLVGTHFHANDTVRIKLEHAAVRDGGFIRHISHATNFANGNRGTGSERERIIRIKGHAEFTVRIHRDIDTIGTHFIFRHDACIRLRERQLAIVAILQRNMVSLDCFRSINPQGIQCNGNIRQIMRVAEFIVGNHEVVIVNGKAFGSIPSESPTSKYLIGTNNL